MPNPSPDFAPAKRGDIVAIHEQLRSSYLGIGIRMVERVSFARVSSVTREGKVKRAYNVYGSPLTLRANQRVLVMPPAFRGDMLMAELERRLAAKQPVDFTSLAEATEFARPFRSITGGGVAA